MAHPSRLDRTVPRALTCVVALAPARPWSAVGDDHPARTLARDIDPDRTWWRAVTKDLRSRHSRRS